MKSALIVVSAKACEAKDALTSAAPSNVLCKDVIGDFNIPSSKFLASFG